MPQPDLIGKPTPSVYLSCYFLGDNDPEVGPKQSQLKSPKLGLVGANFLQFSPAMVPLHSFTNSNILIVYYKNKYILYEIFIYFPDTNLYRLYFN